MSEWEQRQLCPDGACVGVIGSDGTCKVCGRAAPNWGEERKRGLNAEADADEARKTDFDEDDEYYYTDDEDDEDAEDGDDDEGEADESEDGAASVGWSDRKLCPDGACVGVIGDNGACKVCGRRAE